MNHSLLFLAILQVSQNSFLSPDHQGRQEGRQKEDKQLYLKDRGDKYTQWTMDGGSWHCTGDSDQDHPQEKEIQKSKMAIWGGLINICEKRSEKQRRKGKIISLECRVPTHLNAEFQRIARRDKKAFLSNQCKEIEENHRMGKTRDLFKKIRYQGNNSCKDGLNKGQKFYGPNRSRRY